MISIRNLMTESAHSEGRVLALIKEYRRLAMLLPFLALPVSRPLFQQCRERIQAAIGPLDAQVSLPVIEEAGRISTQQLDEIARRNRCAIEERDSALKEVLAAAAKTIDALNESGEKQGGKLGRLADHFEQLTRVDDMSELRRRLREDIGDLRRTLDDLRRENGEAVRSLQAQIIEFRERLLETREDAYSDSLTGLGNRRHLDRRLAESMNRPQPLCLALFDIDGFGRLNERHGRLAGDQLLKSFARLLRAHFPQADAVYRSGPDEFAVLSHSLLPETFDRCQEICAAFGQHNNGAAGNGLPAVTVSHGIAQSIRGESPGMLYRRARAALERPARETPAVRRV